VEGHLMKNNHATFMERSFVPKGAMPARALGLFVLLLGAGCTTEHPFSPPPPPPPPVEPLPATHPIIFSSLRDQSAGTSNLEVLAATIDGSDLINLTRNAASDLEPAWSPDGQLIAFASDRNGNFDIFRIKKDGSDVRQLTFDTMDERAPSWSPDGKKILFESGRDGLLINPSGRLRHLDIFVIDVDGSHLVNLTATPSSTEYGAAWSPDGKTIAFLRSGLIRLVNPDGTNERPLHAPQSGFSDDAVAWSPDSKVLAFSTYNLNHPFATDTYVIFTVNADGTNIKRLTEAVGYSSARFPSFSPDGTRIVFNRDGVDEWWGRFLTQNVFIMNADGSNMIQITRDQSGRNELRTPQAWTK
jgi:Tol biopolymer transport system component